MKGCKKINNNISHGQIVIRKEHHELQFVIMFKQQMLDDLQQQP